MRAFLSVFFLLTLPAIGLAQASADTTTRYQSHHDKSQEQAGSYRRTEQSLARYLAYRDISSLIAEYVRGKEALDDGAGTGLSTQFLQKLGFHVTGVDVSQEMITQAQATCPGTCFHLIEKEKELPLAQESYDLVFSSLVLFELGSEDQIVAYLEQARRVMKKEAVFIAVTGSQTMYSKDWLIFNTDFPENQHLKSGQLAKLYLRDAAIEFTDYYWTEADYRRCFAKAGFELIRVHYPLGYASEPYPWKEETSDSPFVVFVAKKKG